MCGDCGSGGGWTVTFGAPSFQPTTVMVTLRNRQVVLLHQVARYQVSLLWVVPRSGRGYNLAIRQA